MIQGDSSHYTQECEVAFNSTGGYGHLYAMWKTGHHNISTHRTRGEIADLGVDLNTDTSGTKNEFV